MSSLHSTHSAKISMKVSEADDRVTRLVELCAPIFFFYSIYTYIVVYICLSLQTATHVVYVSEPEKCLNISRNHRRTSSVTSMMLQLGWDTLQRSRELARLTMMYRIVHQLVDIPAEPYLTPPTTRTRGDDTRYRQSRRHLSAIRTASSREQLWCGSSSPSQPPHDKTNKMECTPSEDSYQPRMPSLIRIFVVRSMGS